MFDVICAGQAVLDCITRGKEDAPYKPNVYRADTIRLHPGGDAVNESTALAGMGLRVAAVCGVGCDIAGDILLNALSSAGVDTERVRRMPGDTPIANLQVSRDGSRVSVNSDATRLEGYRIDPAEVTGAHVLSLASLFRPPLSDLDNVAALIRAAKAEGTIICADTKLPLRATIHPDALSGVLPLIDFIFPNEKEAEYYTGQTTLPDMACALADRGVGNVVIKAGPAGCYVRSECCDCALPAVPVANVVDTTGAGDNFVAGFITGILDGAPLLDCAWRGLRRAAEAITHTGGATARG